MDVAQTIGSSVTIEHSKESNLWFPLATIRDKARVSEWGIIRMFVVLAGIVASYGLLRLADGLAEAEGVSGE